MLDDAHIFFSTGRVFPHLSLGRLHPESSACWRQRSLVSNYPGKTKPKFEKSRDLKGEVQKQTGVLWLCEWISLKWCKQINKDMDKLCLSKHKGQRPVWLLPKAIILKDFKKKMWPGNFQAAWCFVLKSSDIIKGLKMSLDWPPQIAWTAPPPPNILSFGIIFTSPDT